MLKYDWSIDPNAELWLVNCSWYWSVIGQDPWWTLNIILAGWITGSILTARLDQTVSSLRWVTLKCWLLHLSFLHQIRCLDRVEMSIFMCFTEELHLDSQLAPTVDLSSPLQHLMTTTLPSLRQATWQRNTGIDQSEISILSLLNQSQCRAIRETIGKYFPLPPVPDSLRNRTEKGDYGKVKLEFISTIFSGADKLATKRWIELQPTVANFRFLASEFPRVFPRHLKILTSRTASWSTRLLLTLFKLIQFCLMFLVSETEELCSLIRDLLEYCQELSRSSVCLSKCLPVRGWQLWWRIREESAMDLSWQIEKVKNKSIRLESQSWIL